jgi:E3 SUMO-protein ligase PIAS1
MNPHFFLPCTDRFARYVKDILQSTSRSVDQVTIQPDGKWELHSRAEQPSKSNGFASDDDDDDLIEVTKSGDSVRTSTPRTNGTPTGGPPQRPAESSFSGVPRSSGSTSGKRPISAVIDLTSSGDEDDEPLARSAKRQYSSYGQPSLASYRPAPPNPYLPRP